MIETGKFVAKNENFSIRDLLQFIHSMFMQQMELVGNRFSVQIEHESDDSTDHMPDTLYGDQIRLKQVLVNLVKNAL